MWFFLKRTQGIKVGRGKLAPQNPWPQEIYLFPMKKKSRDPVSRHRNKMRCGDAAGKLKYFVNIFSASNIFQQKFQFFGQLMLVDGYSWVINNKRVPFDYIAYFENMYSGTGVDASYVHLLLTSAQWNFYNTRTEWIL